MRNPFAAKPTADRPRSSGDHRVVRQVASWCLQYPDDELLERVDLLRRALAELTPSASTAPLARFVDHLGSTAPDALRRDYVDVFDLSRRHTLYLTYWSDGDTRRRGEALAAFKQRYRRAGFLVDTHGELTDYLPIVLEFAARVDPVAGHDLLVEYRGSIELIRLALQEADSPYGDVLVSVCATLPGQSPPDKAAALAMQRGPAGAATDPMRAGAVEQVGLDAGDPRLISLSPVVAAPPATVGGPR
jgi:nitrate reductase delta subunit